MIFFFLFVWWENAPRAQIPWRNSRRGPKSSCWGRGRGHQKASVPFAAGKTCGKWGFSSKPQIPAGSLRSPALIISPYRSHQTFVPGGGKYNYSRGKGAQRRGFIANKTMYCNKSSVMPSRASAASSGDGHGGKLIILGWEREPVLPKHPHFQGAKAPAPLLFISPFLTPTTSDR